MLDMRYIVDTPYLVQLAWYATERDIFAASLAFLIIAALYSKDVIAKSLRTILGAKFLYPIAQLSYSGYLMHEMIMIWLFPISTDFSSLMRVFLASLIHLWIGGLPSFCVKISLTLSFPVSFLLLFCWISVFLSLVKALLT